MGPKDHYRVHKRPLVINQANLAHAPLSYYFKIHFIITLSSTLSLPSVFIPSGSPVDTLYTFLFPHCLLHAFSSHISSSLIQSHEKYLVVRSTNYGALCCVIFSSFLLLYLSQLQILSIAPCSRKSSGCVIPLQRNTKFHTKIMQQAKLYLFWPIR